MDINRRYFIKVIGALSVTGSTLFKTLGAMPVPFLRGRIIRRYPGKIRLLNEQKIKKPSRFTG